LVPHGIVEIGNADPRNPTKRVTEGESVAIEVIRRGGCRYPASVEFQCLQRTAAFKRDFDCKYKRLDWGDEDCSPKRLKIHILDDNEYEEDEDFLFVLKAVEAEADDGNSYEMVALGFDRLLIVIPQNDGSVGEIEVHAPSAPIIEGMSAIFEIRRANGNMNRARACYQVLPGTAKLEYDVEFKEGCIEWNHLDSNTSFLSINTVRDDLWEADESFTVKLFNVEGAALSESFAAATGVILKNNLNVALTASTVPPCSESAKKLEIDPQRTDSFFVQFEVFLPAASASTVNDAHIIAEYVTEDTTSLEWMVLDIQGIFVDEMTTSCDNAPVSYDLIVDEYTPSVTRPQLDCPSIINKTVVFDRQMDYLCDRSINCTNFKDTDHRAIINNDTLGKVKQRAFCGDVDLDSADRILCECDFPMIWDEGELVLSHSGPGVWPQTLSRSLGSDLRAMTNQSGWSRDQMATFKFIVKGYDPGMLGVSTTQWVFYLVSDAFPCRETDWGQWTECDADPVGIGHKYRHRVKVNGLIGGNQSCTEQQQHEKCVVNKDKTVAFSSTNIRAKEGGPGRSFTVRLNHEVADSAPALRNTSEMTVDELRELKSFDVVIEFIVPHFFRKEIVVDPPFVAWHRESWDAVRTVTITALDDMNIDQLEQIVSVSATIHSVDSEYDALGVVATLTVIVEDNSKCRYCGLGNVQQFEHVPPPPFWDSKEILIVSALVLIALFLAAKCFRRCWRSYSVENQYKELKGDGLTPELEEDQWLDDHPNKTRDDQNLGSFASSTSTDG